MDVRSSSVENSDEEFDVADESTVG